MAGKKRGFSKDAPRKRLMTSPKRPRQYEVKAVEMDRLLMYQKIPDPGDVQVSDIPVLEAGVHDDCCKLTLTE